MPLLGAQSAALHDTIVLTHRAASRMQLHAGATTLGCQSTCAASSNSFMAKGRPHWCPECFACRPPRKMVNCRHKHTHMHAGMLSAHCAPCAVRSAAAQTLQLAGCYQCMLPAPADSLPPCPPADRADCCASACWFIAAWPSCPARSVACAARTAPAQALQLANTRTALAEPFVPRLPVLQRL
jgi:hypothetical protein